MNNFEIGDRVRMKSYHEMTGIISFIEPAYKEDRSTLIINDNGETYRLGVNTIEIVI